MDQPIRHEPSPGDGAAEEIARVRGHVERALSGSSCVVLAISGGVDSMVLLDAAAAMCPERIAVVATFDHATGPWASEAVALVRHVASRHGLRCSSARARGAARTEAGWREARWSFLRACARRAHASVATAHTRDDQLETVLMRQLRGASARGLAALAAPSPTLRPLLTMSRTEIEQYARMRGLSWLEDPSNRSRAHLRNRVRLDLLPALRRASPAIDQALEDVGNRAASLRRDVEDFVTQHVTWRRDPGCLVVAVDSLRHYDPQGLQLLWPALAARAGITLDRRGTRRLAEFTIAGSRGGRMQLSGGIEVVRHRNELRLMPTPPAVASVQAMPLATGVSVGGWRFRLLQTGAASVNGDLSRALVGSDKALTVRAWQPGDRMQPAGGPRRRVKGLLRDAGIDAVTRRGWPVVLAGEEIVWIPGVRRASAATARPGRPLVLLLAERNDR